MLEIRLHGRGGQGTVVAARILAEALSIEGKFVQAFPEYGVERRGAPVCAFLRIDENVIYERSRIYEPDHIVVLDPALVGSVPITDGLKKGGWIIVNTTQFPKDFGYEKEFKIAIIPAKEIALKYGLGSETSPIVNTAILGGVIKILGLCSLDSLKRAILSGVPIKKEENVKAAEESYNKIKVIDE
ncbi:MAG: 2-oxoacid:acceptor oxidoreductase family protein [candidate division WOR-3 bacterium]